MRAVDTARLRNITSVDICELDNEVGFGEKCDGKEDYNKKVKRIIEVLTQKHVLNL